MLIGIVAGIVLGAVGMAILDVAWRPRRIQSEEELGASPSIPVSNPPPRRDPVQVPRVRRPEASQGRGGVQPVGDPGPMPRKAGGPIVREVR